MLFNEKLKSVKLETKQEDCEMFGSGRSCLRSSFPQASGPFLGPAPEPRRRCSGSSAPHGTSLPSGFQESLANGRHWRETKGMKENGAEVSCRLPILGSGWVRPHSLVTTPGQEHLRKYSLQRILRLAGVRISFKLPGAGPASGDALL